MAQRDVRRELARVLREWDDTVERRLKAFLADPDDVETIHRFRISIRTLRSLLVFVSPFLKRRRHRLLQDELRSVVVETSRGTECGTVALANREVQDEGLTKPLRRVLRRAGREEWSGSLFPKNRVCWPLTKESASGLLRMWKRLTAFRSQYSG